MPAKTSVLRNATTTCSAILFLILTFSCNPNSYDYLIINGRIIDGSGATAFNGDIGIKGDRIVEVGDLKAAKATHVIDVQNRYICPGFIDAHSHAAEGLTTADRSHAIPLLAQGITTVIINPDGFGPAELKPQIEDLMEHGLGINVVPLIGHGAVRESVMGLKNEFADSIEIASMEKLVDEAMKDGAFGFSSGPFYVPGSYSNTEELIALSKIASKYGGVYTSHIRDESNYTIGLLAAVEEVITISKEADIPAVVTHIKALGPPVWGYSDTIIERIEKARSEGLQVWADQYPYNASSTSLGAALLPRWAQAGGQDSLLARLAQPEILAKVKEEMVLNLARRGGANRIQIRSYLTDQKLEGLRLDEVANTLKLDPIDTALELLKNESASITSFNMNENDVSNFMKQPWTMTCSDGAFPEWNSGVPHPRSFGSFPRKLSYFVKEKQIINLPQAINSMTGLTAKVFGLKDRGFIQAGAIADLVIFDLENIRDKATFTKPFQMAEGMDYVFVNGKPAINAGNPTKAMNGIVILKTSND